MRIFCVYLSKPEVCMSLYLLSHSHPLICHYFHFGLWKHLLAGSFYLHLIIVACELLPMPWEKKKSHVALTYILLSFSSFIMSFAMIVLITAAHLKSHSCRFLAGKTPPAWKAGGRRYPVIPTPPPTSISPHLAPRTRRKLLIC